MGFIFNYECFTLFLKLFAGVTEGGHYGSQSFHQKKNKTREVE